MRRLSLTYITLIIALASAAITGCTRTDGIDNNNVIATPYALYFSDTAGALYYTNDGRTFNGSVFKPDGRPCRALTTSVFNVLWKKTHVYYSANNGKNFNHTYDTLTSLPFLRCDGQIGDLNQSSLVCLPQWDNRVYTTSNSPSPNNWLGIAVSTNFGNPRTWGLDASYDTLGVGLLPARMVSFTQLANGKLCGLAYSGAPFDDYYHVRNFVKAGKDDQTDYNNRWKEVTANPDGISYIFMGNLTGTPLPPYGTNTDTSFFTLGHFNNRLIAIDQRCRWGAWYSDDDGKNWAPYSGLPANTALLCIEAPFEEVCLIGTAGKGCYILNQFTGVWEPNNNGLAANATVRGIAAKKNIYKNGNVRKYIYLATDKGIYESTDGGRNWVKTIDGNFVAVN